MLVVCFGDGLGNQMFQYAFYKALQYKYPENKVVADICNFYGSYNNHNGYELERIFGFHLPECDKRTAQCLADYMPASKHKFLNRIYQIRKILFGPKDTFVLQDDPTVFYEEVFQLNRLKSYMFRGNWINEKYFNFISDELIKDFKFPEFESKSNKELVSRMQGRNTVSVHIRRGDYLKTNMEHLDLDYYIKAIKYFENKLLEPVFLFFSDDTEYLNEMYKNVELKHMEVITWNIGSNSFKDMHLMSLCKHNIIANSTFSFWGAYLNQNPNKIVIYPGIAAQSYNYAFACENWIDIKEI